MPIFKNITFFQISFGSRCRQVAALLKHGKEYPLQEPMLAIKESIAQLQEAWPRNCPIRHDLLVSKFMLLLSEPSVPLGKWLTQATDKVLQAKLRDHSCVVSEEYSCFVSNACTVRAGHARDAQLDHDTGV